MVLIKEGDLSPIARGYLTLYRAGRITKDNVKDGVVRGLITAEEYEYITGEPYVA